MSTHIADAFSQLESLNEDIFELTDTGVEKMKEFEEEPVEDEIVVADLDAEDEIDIEDSYVGKVILDCDVCHSKFYKDKDEVIIDDEAELANVGEECVICGSANGYKIIGQVCEFCKDGKCEKHEDEEGETIEDEEDIIDKDDDEIKVSIDKEKFQESLKKAKMKRLIREKLKESRDCVKEDKTSQRDRIDARRDDRVERAKKAFDRARDDADSDRDYRLKKDGLKEAAKPAAISIEDAQKWVDYDMKRYGKISDRTNRLVRKAGFQIIKDQYGDYEVAVGHYESKCAECKDNLTESPIYGLRPEYDTRKSFGGKANVEIDGYGTETLYSYDTPVARYTKEGNVELLPKWDYSQTTLRHVKEFLRQHGLKADSLAQIRKDYLGEECNLDERIELRRGAPKGMGAEEPMYVAVMVRDQDGEKKIDVDGYFNSKRDFMHLRKELLRDGAISDLALVDRNNKDDIIVLKGKKDAVVDYIKTKLESVKAKCGKKIEENFERVDIETDREKMSMTAEDDGKVVVTTEPKKEKKEEEVIEPVDDETKEEIEDNSIDIDMDEFEEETFDELGESYLKKVYENVESYKSTQAINKGNKVVVEGMIKFNSGKSKKTTFVFESHSATKDKVVKFIGENKEITRGRKAFTLTGKVDKKKFIAESFNYNYRTKDDAGNSQRVYGTIKK